LREIVRYLAARTDLRCGVVVVDNGSADRTAELADALVEDPRVPVSVIGCSEPGKGAAVRRGINTSRARYVGFCDADLATPIEAVEQVLRKLDDGNPVVIGSRRCEGATYTVPQTRRRRLGGWLFRRQTRDLSGPVADTQCGFKFFHLAAAQELFDDIRTSGFVFDVELIARARAAGLPVTEVPVAWSDQDGSSLHPLRDGRAIAADLRLIRSMYLTPAGRPALREQERT
jgi:glycosyltransferase involved in cell wall biosynthesis